MTSCKDAVLPSLKEGRNRWGKVMHTEEHRGVWDDNELDAAFRNWCT